MGRPLLRRYGRRRHRPDDPRYRRPLVRDARALAVALGGRRRMAGRAPGKRGEREVRGAADGGLRRAPRLPGGVRRAGRHEPRGAPAPVRGRWPRARLRSDGGRRPPRTPARATHAASGHLCGRDAAVAARVSRVRTPRSSSRSATGASRGGFAGTSRRPAGPAGDEDPAPRRRPSAAARPGMTGNTRPRSPTTTSSTPPTDRRRGHDRASRSAPAGSARHQEAHSAVHWATAVPTWPPSAAASPCRDRVVGSRVLR